MMRIFLAVAIYLTGFAGGVYVKVTLMGTKLIEEAEGAAHSGDRRTDVLKLRDMSGYSTIADNDKSRQAGQRLRDMVTGIGPVTG